MNDDLIVGDVVTVDRRWVVDEIKPGGSIVVLRESDGLGRFTATVPASWLIRQPREYGRSITTSVDGLKDATEVSRVMRDAVKTFVKLGLDPEEYEPEMMISRDPSGLFYRLGWYAREKDSEE